MRAAIGTLLFLSGCSLNGVLCAPCTDGCPAGLTCTEGRCVSEGNHCGLQIVDDTPCPIGLRRIDRLCVGPVDADVGVVHSCAVWPDGKVSCRGKNFWYQVGTDDSLHVFESRFVEGIDDAVEIACGYSHTCARREGGRISCWGSNRDALLGPLPGPTGVPVDIDLPEGFVATEMTIGPNVNFVTDADGNVHAWGGRESESTNGHGIIDGMRFDKIATGWGHACGLRAGQMLCWGDLAGLGLSGTQPVVAGGPNADVIDIAALWEPGTACLLRRSGRVECFGTGFLGEVPTSTDVVALEGGLRGICGRHTDHRVSCWGAGEFDGSVAASLHTSLEPDDLFRVGGPGCAFNPKRPLRCWGGNGSLIGSKSGHVDTPQTVVTSGAVSVGIGRSTCALTKDKSLICWGARIMANTNGAARVEPTPTTLLENAEQISLAGGFSCVVQTDGAVSCWGQSGSAPVADPESSTLTSQPNRIQIPPALEVATGASVACALLTDATVRCWGQWPGSVNDGGTPIFEPSGLPQVRHVATGLQHACAIDTSDQVWCWGINDQGQSDGLGQQSPLADVRPIRIPGVAAKRLGLGYEHSCAQTIDDRVVCWGGNTKSQIGRSPGGRFGPTAIDATEGTTSLAVTARGACALRGIMPALCWGEVASILSREGERKAYNGASWLPTTVPELAGARHLAIAEQASCVVSADESVQCWGVDEWSRVSGEAHDAHALHVIDAPVEP